jgi:CheY-like chemotaxis protein
MSILIVDDDEDIRDLLSLILRLEGHEVQLAVDGVDALARLSARRPSVILLDMMMPRLDGEGFVKELRNNPQLADIPIVLISGHKAARQKAVELGVAGCLVKPIELTDLLSTLNGIAG